MGSMYYVMVSDVFKYAMDRTILGEEMSFVGKLVGESETGYLFRIKTQFVVIPMQWIEFMAPCAESVVDIKC